MLVVLSLRTLRVGLALIPDRPANAIRNQRRNLSVEKGAKIALASFLNGSLPWLGGNSLIFCTRFFCGFLPACERFVVFILSNQRWIMSGLIERFEKWCELRR